jgi:hypothetical protein
MAKHDDFETEPGRSFLGEVTFQDGFSAIDRTGEDEPEPGSLEALEREFGLRSPEKREGNRSREELLDDNDDINGYVKGNSERDVAEPHGDSVRVRIENDCDGLPLSDESSESLPVVQEHVQENIQLGHITSGRELPLSDDDDSESIGASFVDDPASKKTDAGDEIEDGGDFGEIPVSFDGSVEEQDRHDQAAIAVLPVEDDGHRDELEIQNSQDGQVYRNAVEVDENRRQTSEQNAGQEENDMHVPIPTEVRRSDDDHYRDEPSKECAHNENITETRIIDIPALEEEDIASAPSDTNFLEFPVVATPADEHMEQVRDSDVDIPESQNPLGGAKVSKVAMENQLDEASPEEKKVELENLDPVEIASADNEEKSEAPSVGETQVMPTEEEERSLKETQKAQEEPEDEGTYHNTRSVPPADENENERELEHDTPDQKEENSLNERELEHDTANFEEQHSPNLKEEKQFHQEIPYDLNVLDTDVSASKESDGNSSASRKDYSDQKELPEEQAEDGQDFYDPIQDDDFSERPLFNPRYRGRGRGKLPTVSSDEEFIPQGNPLIVADPDASSTHVVVTDLGFLIHPTLEPELEAEVQPEGEEEQQRETGMIVADPEIDWSSTDGFGQGIGAHSVEHLPPLTTNPEQDSLCDALLKQYIRKGVLPEVEQRMPLVQYIQRQKVNAVCASRFAEAGILQQISQKILQAIALANSEGHYGVRVYSLEDKLVETVEKIKVFQKETARIVKEEQKRWRDRRHELDEKHLRELSVFETKWNDEEFLRQFAKPSSHLLSLKRTERNLVLSKEFERAEEAKKEVVRLEKEESVEAQKHAEYEMKKQQIRLLERQVTEARALADAADKAILAMESERLQLLEGLLARQVKLEAELEAAKSIKPTCLPSLKQTKGQEKTEAVMTPRTAQRYAVYKAVMNRPKVTVKPLGFVNRKIAQKRRKRLRPLPINVDD